MSEQEQPAEVSEVHDPAEDHEVSEVQGDRDDVDVPLALMNKNTDDGKGDDAVPASDFPESEDD